MYVIIGQGAAGMSAAITLRRLDATTPITMLTNEQDCFYSRIDLPDIIAAKLSPAAAALTTPAQLADCAIDYRPGEQVIALDPATRSVVCASGLRLNYHKLLLATGSQPTMPALPGINATGVHTLWTMPQATAIAAAAKAAQSVVVIGAGLIGLKTALALRAHELKVTVIEQQPQVLPRQLDSTAAAIVAKALAAEKIELITGVSVQSIATSAGKVCGVTTAVKTVECDLVIVAVGVKPQTKLAVNARLNVGHGITVNELLQTSVSDIYAAGDAAEVIDCVTGRSVVPATWPVAVEQGRIAAYNMAGHRATFTGSIAENSVEVAGMPIVSAGDIIGGNDDEIIVRHSNSSYRKLVINNGRVRGALFVGDIRHAGVVVNLLAKQTVLTGRINPAAAGFSFADIMAG